MRTINGHVACSPFETTSLKISVDRGLAIHTQRHELTKLAVVLDYGTVYNAGDSVFVRGECMKHAYALAVYEIEGKKFILVPEDQIVAVEAGKISEPKNE